MGEAMSAARELYEELTGDIEKAKTREEHIRVSARANAAALLLEKIERALDPISST
jgi:hypothetical protein